ncbi:hypothetical protein BX666DRAFT_2111018 [Dichotomocladium elegans]|nr:hypothetical protein BX666DRAFT_2111018 [Dichotomocladium elegans]
MSNDDNKNDKRQYEPVKLPASISDWMKWNRNCDVCFRLCEKPTEKNPSPGCKTMCLVRLQDSMDQQQTNSEWLYNPLRNYAIAVDPADKPEQSYQVNLGDQLDRVGHQVNRIAKTSYDTSKSYIDSWKDGSQTAFFRRIYEISVDKDQLQMLKDHARKTIDVFWNAGNNDKKDSENKKDRDE